MNVVEKVSKKYNRKEKQIEYMKKEYLRYGFLENEFEKDVEIFFMQFSCNFYNK